MLSSEIEKWRENIVTDESMISSHCYREGKESFLTQSPTFCHEKYYSDEENDIEEHPPQNHDSIIDMFGWYTDNYPDNLDERFWIETCNR